MVCPRRAEAPQPFADALRADLIVLLCFWRVCGATAAGHVSPVEGLQGAIPFEMPVDGEATLALYNDRGGAVRILGECVKLAKGSYVAV